MKHGKKPTVRQAKILQAHGMNPENWLIERESPETLTAIHRYTDTKREIPKNERDS